MVQRSPADKARRAEARHREHAECRHLLATLATLVGQRRPQPEIDAARQAATEWLRAHPRTR